MADTYVTGPVHHYCVFPYNPTQAFYLGTAQIAPKVRIRRALKPVFNDLGGQLLPFERILQGEEAQIITPLNRYNESVYRLISAFPRMTGIRGRQGPLDTGVKMQGNGCFFSLILQFPFAGTANDVPVATEQLPPVYRFPVCQSEQDEFTTMGTDAFEKMLAITAARFFTPASGGSGIAGGFITYFNDLGGISLPTPN